MCRSPNSSANRGLADGTRSVPATFVGHVKRELGQSCGATRVVSELTVLNVSDRLPQLCILGSSD